MRLPTPCGICFKEANGDWPSPTVPITFFPGRVSDFGYVHLKCSKGHESIVLFDERKQDLIFRSGCHALIDGHDREAVSSFAAALERCYEFFVRVAARHMGVTSAVFEDTWKLVAKQSERQFGLFAGLYCLISGTAYIADQKKTEFRNKVIHQGYIPAEGETEAFGAYVFDQMLCLSTVLGEKCKPSLDQEMTSEKERMKKNAPAGIPQLGFKATLVNVDRSTNTAYEITKFSDFILGLKENRPTSKPG